MALFGITLPPPSGTLSAGSGVAPGLWAKPPAGKSLQDLLTHNLGVLAAQQALSRHQHPPPAPEAQPSDQADWLRTYGGSPVFIYPQFGWSFDSAGNASASFDRGPGDHVWWSWTRATGAWSYHHVWGGFDLGRSLDSIANAVGIVAAGLGIIGASQLVYTLHALAGHGSPDALASALKADWDNFQAAGGLADAVSKGDWESAWNAVTADGKKLSALQHVFSPQPAPDAQGKLSLKGSPMSVVIAPVRTTFVKPLADAAAASGMTTQQYVRSAMAIGAAPPPITPSNPQGGRTIMGIPVVDIGVAAVVLGGLGYVFRSKLGL